MLNANQIVYDLQDILILNGLNGFAAKLEELIVVVTEFTKYKIKKKKQMRSTSQILYSISGLNDKKKWKEKPADDLLPVLQNEIRTHLQYEQKIRKCTQEQISNKQKIVRAEDLREEEWNKMNEIIAKT